MSNYSYKGKLDLLRLGFIFRFNCTKLCECGYSAKISFKQSSLYKLHLNVENKEKL